MHKHGSYQRNHEPDICTRTRTKPAPETKKQEGKAIGQPLLVLGFDETIMSRNPLHA